MPSPRTPRPSLVGGLALLLLTLAPLSLAASDAPYTGGLAGRVRDLLGQRIPDVEVLVVSPSSGGNPVAETRSDASGLFTVPGLAPGFYRVAALKGGYLTYLGQVNTRVDRWLDVVLRPAAVAADSSNAVAEDATWALRLPRRSLLRETDPEPVAAGRSAAGGGGETPPGAGAPLRMQVEQLFALRRGPGEDAGATTGGRGTETRLSMGSALGRRGNVRFRGVHESYDASHSSGRSSSSASQGAADMRLDLLYDTGPDARVAVEAFYSERDLRLTAESAEIASGTTRQGRRSWGYDAVWSRQIDAGSSLSLGVDLVESKLDLLPDPQATSPEPGDEVSHRSVGAVGSYESLQARDHRVQVDFRARLVDAPLPSLTAPLGDRYVDPYAVPGWSVGVEARDTWRVSGPFSLVYGLGYRHSLASQDVSLFVPRAGGTWSIDELVLSFLVSYHQVESWGGPDSAAAAPAFRPARRLGYEALVELPLGGGLSLRGSTRSAPIQLDPAGATLASAAGEIEPAFLTDGNAAVREDRIALVREGAGVSTFLEMVEGKAEGSVAPMLSFAMPYRWLSEGSLRYRNGRLGVRVASSGTDLLLDYREVAEQPTGIELATRDFEQQSLELRVAQDVMRLRTLGSWRFLLALRMASLEGEGVGEWLRAGDARPLSAPDREMSAGLSVLF